MWGLLVVKVEAAPAEAGWPLHTLPCGCHVACRFFAEECDSLQGFQVLADDLSGFGNLACQVLQVGVGRAGSE